MRPRCFRDLLLRAPSSDSMGIPDPLCKQDVSAVGYEKIWKKQKLNEKKKQLTEGMIPVEKAWSFVY